ncbi:MAG: hypothetical protein L3J95_00885 [Thermoplasmata archaeon]|nr:hypothetical protein [Thermoplasmata archaeon]MCI4358973.1 hypothetical protein [Thermoplasmata archaeon]
MNRSYGTLWTLRGDGRAADRSTRTLLLGVLVLLTVLGALSVLGPSGRQGSAVAPSRGTLATPHLLPAVSTQYGGDLTVPSGVNMTLGPSTGSLTYYEGGNITVASGGYLTVRNTTIVFVESVGNGGTVTGQLSHIYHLADQGTLVLVNSSITTFVPTLDPYPILTVTVTGVFQMTNGTLAFPGSITVNGSAANFWVSHTLIERNPAVSRIVTNASANGTGPAGPAFVNVARYGPTLLVLGGAQATFLASSLNDTFQDPLNGTTLPGVQPSGATPVAPNAVLGGTAPAPLVLPSPPNAPALLALAAAYPTVTSGSLAIVYNSTAAATSSNSRFAIGGSSWAFGTISFASASGAAVVHVPIPAAAIGAINQGGVTSYLSALSSGQVAVQFGTSSAPVTIHNVTVTFLAPWSYNVTVSGAGSTLTAADSTLDLNWNATPGMPGRVPYTPSASNKLILSGGAQAFLANVSVPSAAPIGYTHQSFVVPDASSSAVFYRWLNVPVRGENGIIVQGATVQADYAYSGASSYNATVTAANNLATADPALSQYVATWDKAAGVPAYGEVGPTGNASLLLASGNLSAASLPDGNFLGAYHVDVTANPGSQAISQWIYASVTPYPYHMQPRGPNATGPVQTPTVVFPTYRVIVSWTSPTLTSNAQPVTNDTVAIGENVTVLDTVRNTGTGTATDVFATLFWLSPSFPAASSPIQSLGSIAPGGSVQVKFNWLVLANLTYVIKDPNLNSTFAVDLNWQPGHMAATTNLSVHVVPAYISFSGTGLTGTLVPGSSYTFDSQVAYYGTGGAILNVTGRSTTGATFALVLGKSITQGSTPTVVSIETALPPGTYNVHASVYHAGRTVWYNATTPFTIASPPGSNTTPWYDQSFFGLPLWIWLAIVAAIVAGIGLFLLISVQKAKGKMVECGECGAMIPETALACPECGAEFESDRVRCSRCGSTIPGNSAVCPECAATLLGRAGEEKDDPERQGYADFVERFRTEGRKALGDSYSEGSFWDWWKRQSTYVPFGQWKMQQAQGSRVGMGAPRESTTPEAPRPRAPPARRPPPSSGTAPAAAPKPMAPKPAPPPEPVEEAPPAAAGLITCANCGKEIPSGYLVCPFCGAVTQ